MTTDALWRAAQAAAEIAVGCRGQAAGPALVVCAATDTFRMDIRDEAVTTRRTRQAGTGLEYLEAGSRRHLFTDRLDEQAPGELARAARAGTPVPSGSVPAAAAPDTAMLTEETVGAIGAAARAAAEAIGGYDGTRLTPFITAEAVRECQLIVRGDGVRASTDLTRLELRIGARVRGGIRDSSSLRVLSSTSPAGLVSGDQHLSLARQVARQALDRLAVVDAPEESLPVILGPGSPAALLHEVCGHGLEVDAAWSAGASYQPPAGRRVGSPLVTIRDDPRRPAHAPLYEVDNEGNPASELTMIADGMLTGWLVDRYGSGHTGLAPTGHGRRLSHAYPALARMGTTYLAAGSSAPAEALAGVRRGLYVKAIVAGETDMSSKAFVVLASEADLIENGRITAPVRRSWLAGPGAAVLHDIDVVCDDLEFVAYGFQCGKLGQRPLTVSVGQPTIRIRELGVTPA